MADVAVDANEWLDRWLACLAEAGCAQPHTIRTHPGIEIRWRRNVGPPADLRAKAAEIAGPMPGGWRMTSEGG